MLEEREGVRLTAYKDSVGVWTIGLGHTSSAGPPHVHQGLQITREQATEIFRRDVEQFEDAVRAAVKRPMTQHEFDAYVSFSYNVGPNGFARSQSVERFNRGDKAGAAEGLLHWMKPPEIKPRRYGEYWQFKDGRLLARADSAGAAVG